MNKYEECVVVFVPVNLPKELNFSVLVNGHKYTGRERITVPVFDHPFIKWEVDRIAYGDVVF
ncbi:MAG: hypothetical protein RXR07_06495, partial [Sulfolobaceae archaeon]